MALISWIEFWRRTGAALGRTVILSNSVRIGKQSCPYSTKVHCIAAADGHEKSLWKKRASLAGECPQYLKRCQAHERLSVGCGGSSTSPFSSVTDGCSISHPAQNLKKSSGLLQEVGVIIQVLRQARDRALDYERRPLGRWEFSLLQA